MILDKKKFENYHCDQYRFEQAEDEIRTMSVLELQEAIDNIARNAKANNIALDEMPVFIETHDKKYCIKGSTFGFGKCGTFGTITTEFEGEYSEHLYYVASDSRPEEGEYWESRGVSDYDVSGFVKSKLAGERLLRMVKYLLETDAPKSWLDYREREPNWIQFKFRCEEFDLELLDSLSKEAGGVITLDILKKCKKQN